MPDVRIDVYTDTKGSYVKLKEVQDGLAGVERQGGSTHGTLGGLWKQFAAGNIAADLLRQGLRIVKNEFADSIKQAIEYQRAAKGLDAAFAISGRTMPGMVANLKKYAGELEKLGLAEDDEILRAESMLLQFTDLDEKGIKAATRGAIGLASVFTMDLQSAAEAVKNGTEGNYRALSMLIPEIRQATTEEGKRAAMMKGFEELYARAIADTKTYAGQVQTLGLEWKSAKMELGAAALKTGILQEAIFMLRDGLHELTSWSRKKPLAQVIAENNAAGVSLEKLAERLGWSKRAMTLLRVETGLSSSMIRDHILSNWKGVEAAEALAKVLAEEAAELGKAKKGFSETGVQAQETAPKIQRLGKHFEELNEDLRLLRMYGANIFAPINDSFGTLGDVIGGTMGSIVDFVEKPDPDLFKGIVGGAKTAATKTNLVWDSMVSQHGKAMATILATTSVMFSGMNAVINQAQQNRMIEIDNEYKKRVEAIEKSTASEEEKQQKLLALEAEYQIKKSEAQRKGAKAAKAVNLLEAVTNTASGVSRAFKDYPFPLSAVIAGIVAALGLIQIKLIASQPIPLAQGGYFKKRTVLPGRDGRGYDLAEAGPALEGEIVSPVPIMRQIVREEGRGGVHVEFGAGAIQIYAQTLDERTVLRVGPLLGRALNEQLRIHGRSPLWQT